MFEKYYGVFGEDKIILIANQGLSFICSCGLIVFIFSKDKQIEALNEELKQETMMTDTMVANMVSVDRSVFKEIYVIDLCPQ